jgi:hypothetical protein
MILSAFGQTKVRRSAVYSHEPFHFSSSPIAAGSLTFFAKSCHALRSASHFRGDMAILTISQPVRSKPLHIR